MRRCCERDRGGERGCHGLAAVGFAAVGFAAVGFAAVGLGAVARRMREFRARCAARGVGSAPTVRPSSPLPFVLVTREERHFRDERRTELRRLEGTVEVRPRDGGTTMDFTVRRMHVDHEVSTHEHHVVLDLDDAGGVIRLPEVGAASLSRGAWTRRPGRTPAWWCRTPGTSRSSLSRTTGSVGGSNSRVTRPTARFAECSWRRSVEPLRALPPHDARSRAEHT